MKTSQPMFNYICKVEGFKPNLYVDCAGHTTIGYGHLVHLGPIDGSEPEEFKRGIDQKQGLGLLLMELGEIENDISELVKVPVTQNQFDALVSFTFNLGRGNLERSTLLKLLNQKQYSKIPAEIRRWTKADGKVMMGLVNRRNYEANLFYRG